MKRIIKGLFVICAFALCMSSFAKDIRIGVLDVHKLIETSAEVKAINKRLQAEFKPRQDSIISLQRELQQKMTRLDREKAVMSDKEKSNLQDDLIVQRRKLQRLEQDYQQDLNAANNREMKTFFDKLKKNVDSFASQNKYDLIIQNDAVSLFNSNEIDVTSAVIKSNS